jgi:hypothetical protein
MGARPTQQSQQGSGLTLEQLQQVGAQPTSGTVTQTPERLPGGFAGDMARTIARPFLRTAATARQIPTAVADVGRAAVGRERKLDPTQPVGFGRFFGEVDPIRMGQVDATLGEAVRHPLRTAGQIAGAAREPVGVGLEMGAILPPARAVGTAGGAILRGRVGRGIRAGAVSGAQSGALAGAGISLQEGRDLRGVATETGVGALGGLLLGGALGGGGAAVIGRPATTARRGVDVAIPTKGAITREQRNLKTALEDAFREKATLRKKNEIASQFGAQPAEVFARFGAVPKIVKGRMRTEDIVTDFQSKINERLSVRRPVLEQMERMAPETTSITANNLQMRVLNSIANDPQIKKKGLVKQTQDAVRRRMEDFRSTYGNRISLTNVDDIRSGQGALTRAFKDVVYEADAAEAIARVSRDVVEDKTQNTVLGAINREIRDLINAKDIAQAMNDTPIRYGRFSQWMARLTGTVIGSQGIPVIGPLIGAMGGDMFVRMLQQNAFGGPLQRRILQHVGDDRALLNTLRAELPESMQKVLMREVQNAMRQPRLPAPRSGTPQQQVFTPAQVPPRGQVPRGIGDEAGVPRLNQ